MPNRCTKRQRVFFDAGTEGSFRLTGTSSGDSSDSESGILEVFHAGAWGTLCNGDFGILEVHALLALSAFKICS